MAGAGYKLFNTGDVLTAQQVNEYLMQQTVMVFADASARTTALSGVLAEGMLSYLKSTDSTEVYNGSAWVALAADQTPLTTKGDLFTYTTADARLASSNVNGDVLTVDTSTASGLKWATPVSGAFTLISSQTPSAVSSLSFSSIPQTYKHLLLTWEGVFHSATGSTFDIRFNNNTTDYNWGGVRQGPGGTSVSADGSGGSSLIQGVWSFGDSVTSASNSDRVKGTLWVYDYTSTTRVKTNSFSFYYYKAATGGAGAVMTGQFNALSAISSIDIFRASGTATFSTGTNCQIKLYGVN